MPLGIADSRIGFATFTIADVLAAMTGVAATPHHADQPLSKQEVTSDA